MRPAAGLASMHRSWAGSSACAPLPLSSSTPHQRYPRPPATRHLTHTAPSPSTPLSPGPHPQIVSGSRDKTIKLWNTLGECKYTIGEPDGHTEWVSCVRFSPVTQNPIIVSAGWDKAVKVGAPPLPACLAV